MYFLKKNLVNLIFIMFLFCCTNVLAATAPNGVNELTVTNYINLQYIYGSMEDGKIVAYLKNVNNTENFAYCIEANDRTLKVGDKLYYDGILSDPGIVYIAKNGYPNVTFSHLTHNRGVVDEKESYYITQLALWMYYYVVGDENGNKIFPERLAGYIIDKNGNMLCEYSGCNYRPSALEKFRQYVLTKAAYDLFVGAREAHNAGKGPTPSLSLTNANTTLSVNGDFLLSEPITINLIGTDICKVSLDNNNAVITDVNGNVIDSPLLKNGDKFRIKVSGVASTSVKATVTATASENVVYKYSPTSSSKQSVMYSVMDIKKIPLSSSVTVNYTIVGKDVSISKQDATTGKELAGAKLKLVDSQGNLIDEWISTTTPHIIKLNPGKYKLTETIAPEGYVLSEEVVEFTVNNDGGTDPIKVVMNNKYIEVPITSLNTPLVVILSSLVIGLFGVGVIYISKKKFS